MPAPTLNFKYEVSVDATEFIITDLTGDYLDNGSGWGTANFELDETAIFAVVKRKASAADEFFTAQTLAVTFNPVALNTAQTQIKFDYLNDGVLEITMGILQASTDGINLLAGGAIPENAFFYWAYNGGYVWQMIGGAGGVGTATPVEINDLIDENTVVQELKTDILEPKLAIQKQLLYKRWVLKRKKEDDDAEPIFNELLKLSQDIQGSIYAFYSGLTVEAQDQVETMLTTYKLQ